MLNQKFKIGMTPSWDLVPLNFKLLQHNFEAILSIVILPALTINLGSLLLASNRLIGFVVLAVGGVWWLLNTSATYYLQLSAARGKTFSAMACYTHSWRYFMRIIGFSLFFAVLLICGLILLIIPGLIVLRRYILSPFYIIDNNLTITQAMRKSAAQTKSASGYIWGTLAVIISISLTVALISELFYSVPGLSIIINTLLSPLYYFLLALRYNELTKLRTVKS